METARLYLFAGILAGSAAILLASSLALRFGMEAQRLMIGAAWFGMAIGIASFMALALSAGQTPARAKASAFSASDSPAWPEVDVERYARLLARLEELRAQGTLPQDAYLRLREDYLQRLSAALEGRTKVY